MDFTNNQTDYACPYCGSRQLVFLRIVLMGRLSFICKEEACRQGFETEDMEGKSLRQKIVALQERYPA